MNTPAGLLAAACALWGVQTGYWPIAIAAAIALEAPRLVALRWNIEQAHFNRLSDFCSVLVLLVGGYLYFTFGNPRALMLLFQWLPLLLLPLAAAQAWGNLRKVDVAAFVWTLRRSGSEEHFALNLGYPCLAVWVVAAAATYTRGPLFYAGLAALVALALWSVRPRRYPVVLWIVLLAVTASAGYGVQLGLFRAQAWLEEVVPEWIGASGSRTDPYLTRTDLGHIGELKQDDAIVLRVRVEGNPGSPLLLHRASYNGYFGGSWAARNAPLQVIRPPDAGAPWTLVRDAAPTAARVTVYDFSPRGNPVLSLPLGVVEVRGLKALGLKRNRLGTVQAELPPGHFSYVAALGAGAEAAPNEDDLRIPQSERKLFDEIADRLGLTSRAPDAIAEAVKGYFADGFKYTTYQKTGAGGRSALADFLLRTKSGHCEYFATATVLLLRAAGVPARYATGFSAQEYSKLEDAYIVRVRHAHAWVYAWVDGRWIEIDTTPSSWAVIEGNDASWWAPVSDLWAWARFRLAQLGAGAQDEDRVAAISAGVALLVALWFGWRLYRQRKLMIFGTRVSKQGAEPARAPGSDSELFQIERALAQAGLARAEGETVMAWLARIRDRLPAGPSADSLIPIARLHYRYRFDPAGLPSSERAQLRELALQWLADWPRFNAGGQN